MECRHQVEFLNKDLRTSNLNGEARRGLTESTLLSMKGHPCSFSFSKAKGTEFWQGGQPECRRLKQQMVGSLEEFG